MQYISQYNSLLGKIVLASEENYLTGLWFENQKYFGSTLREEYIKKDDLKIFEIVKKWLDNYFAGKNPSIDELKIKPSGTNFRKIVWQLLCYIPYGEVITYKELSQKVAKILNIKSMSSQAIGGAVGHNPISIIIPCHRVVGTNKKLVGYAGGLDKKIKLLELEGNNIYNLK